MSHARGTAAGVSCLLVLLSGCATIPTSGPVLQGEGGANAADQGESSVRLVPVPPQPGVTPTELVRDFLSSVGSFDNEFRAARAFMTPERQSGWRPDETALIYDDRELVEVDVLDSDDEAGTAQVELGAVQLGTIAPDGQFQTADPGTDITISFELEQVDEEWRIAELPDELLLSSSDVDRVYRSLNLYFLNSDSSVLVPDTVLLPTQSPCSLAGALTRRLVAGPTEWLDPAVSTAFPQGLAVDIACQSGQLTVDLGREAGAAATDDRFRMAAQLAWTLKQLPGVQEFRLRVGGEELSIPGGGTGWQQVSSPAWNSMDPSGIPDDARAYFVREGELWSLDDELNDGVVAGAAGTGDTALERHAVAVDESQVAGISAGQQEVLVADLAEGGEFAQVLGDGLFTALSWDGYGNLWVAEDIGDETSDGAPDPGTRLWLLRDGTDPVEVDAPALAQAAVSQISASRDGTRAAVLVDDPDAAQLMLGRVVDDGDRVELGEFIPLATDLDDFSDVAWRSADQLAVLGQSEGGGMQSYLVATGGSAESTGAGATAPADMVTIAAAPGAPLLSGADDDHIWLTNDRLLWQRETEGANPVYPG